METASGRPRQQAARARLHASLAAMNNRLKALLGERSVLLADGATGTNLFQAGLQTGDPPELWNLEHPERIDALHRSFVDAGSDIVLTNSFGGTHFRLALHQSADRVHEVNVAAAQLARGAADRETTRTVLVAGSMGPTGEILEPNGAVSVAEARAAFNQQAKALVEGGVDVLWLETLSSAEEMAAGIGGASGFGVPVVCTVSIDTNGRTMMGLTAADSLRIAREFGAEVLAVGTNCGVGAAEVVAAISNFSTAASQLPDASDVPPVLVAKANCGIPAWKDGQIVYDGTPALMADYASLVIDAGARIVGGCCGTTPAHVAAMRAAIDAHVAGPAPDANAITALLGEISQGARAQLNGDLSLAGGSASGRGSRSSRRRKSR